MKDVSISGTREASGDLAGGFELTTNADSLLVGAPLDVTAKWKVTKLKEVSFWIQKCEVIQNKIKVNLIDGGCYSTALHVTRGTETGVEMGFTFSTFLMMGAEGIKSTIKDIIFN